MEENVEVEGAMRYEIHVQNEDGSSSGDVIIIYSSNQNEPIQELVTKALEQLSEQKSQNVQNDMVNPNGQQLPITKTEFFDTFDNFGEAELYQVEGATQDASTIQVSFDDTLHVERQHQNSGDLQLEKVQDNTLLEIKQELCVAVQEEKHEPKSSEDPDDVLDNTELNADLNDAEALAISSELQDGETQAPAESNSLKVEVSEPMNCTYEGCDYVTEEIIEYQRHLKFLHEVKTPFQCTVCEKKFKLEISLQIHDLIHKEIPAMAWDIGKKVKKHFSCPFCHFQNFYKRIFLQHLLEEHSTSEVFTCDKCKVVCLSQEDIKIHMGSLTHEENQRTLCSLCGMSCKNINQHMRRVHSNEKPFLCTECGYKCKFSGSLKAHMLIHSAERAFKCDVCDYAARSKDQLKRHMVRHSNVKDFLCPNCNYATQTSYRLKKHMKIHAAMKAYKCTFCSFKTKDKMMLKKHKKDTHSKKLFLSCKDCKMTFSCVQDLKVHAMSIHRSTDSWFCKFCEFSCQSRIELGKHMQKHAGMHRYVCSLCGYSCRHSNPFKRHMARHDNVKKYMCSLCDYSCSDKYDLEKHVVTHSDTKPVSCPNCSYTCRSKAQLKRHTKLVHSEVKPYFCSYCNYTTKSPQNLKNHMYLHSDRKPHACVLCDFSACQKSNLKRHMQTHLKKAQILYVQ